MKFRADRTISVDGSNGAFAGLFPVRYQRTVPALQFRCAGSADIYGGLNGNVIAVMRNEALDRRFAVSDAVEPDASFAYIQRQAGHRGSRSNRTLAGTGPIVNQSLPPAPLSLSSPRSFPFAQPNLNALRRNWPGS